MVNQVPTRTKRRMEKRHAVLMLTLVLVVSLISFGLGIMVGKRGTPPAAEKEKPPLVTRMPATPAPAETAETSETPPAPQPPPPAGQQHLTFYETLKEVKKQPLGTGINLPSPEEEHKEKVPAAPAHGPADVESSPAVAPVPPAPARQSAVKSESPVPGGEYVVQTGSFQKMEDAERFKAQLTAKGYAAFVQRADLKEKGIWYRVLLGPVGTKSDAEVLAGDLKKKEKLSGFVRKM